MIAALDRGDVFERHSWRPAPGDTATLKVIYCAEKPAPEMALEKYGALTPFQMAVQRPAESAVDSREPSPSRYALPLSVPVPNADSVVVTVAFDSTADVSSLYTISSPRPDFVAAIRNSLRRSLARS